MRKNKVCIANTIIIRNSILIFIVGLLIGIVFIPSNITANANSLQNNEEVPVISIRQSVIDNSGNVFITGVTSNDDIYFTKFTSSGQQVWQRTILGNGIDDVETLKIDQNGDLLLLATTESDDLETVNAIQEKFGGKIDVFLSKWDTNGNILWSTYLGGSGEELIQEKISRYREEDILIDNDNNIYVYGITESNDYPVRNAIQDTYKGSANGFIAQSSVTLTAIGGDGFITKFNSNGSLAWSTFYGTSGWDTIRMTLDKNFDLIIFGHTDGNDLPILSAEQNEYRGGSDSFIAKLSKSGNLEWSTYLGGSGEDWIWDVVVDNQNNLYFSSNTDSVDRETKNAFQDYFGGHNSDYFFTKLDKFGVIQWSTYFGGKGNDDQDYTKQDEKDLGIVDTEELLIDANDNLIFYGRTSSTDLVERLINPLPTYGIPNIEYSSGLATLPLIIKFDENGVPKYITLVGGSGSQIISDILLDNKNNLFVTGFANSIDYPVINALQNQSNGVLDITVTKLAENGTGLWSTYFGGSERDDLVKTVLDSEGNLILIGTTESADFPNTGFKEFSGEKDIFITKLSSEGELLWSNLVGGSGKESINRLGILVSPIQGIALLGTTESVDLSIGGEEARFVQSSFIVKYNNAGTEEFASYVYGESSTKNQNNDFLLKVIALITITISGIGYYFVNRYIVRKREVEFFLNQNMTNLLSPIFKSNPSLVYLFGATKIDTNENLERVLLTDIPAEILDFKYFLHPIRLSMIKLLDENPAMTSIQLKDALGISWRDVTNHLNSMKKKGYISVEQKFVEDSVRTVIVANPNTLTKFKTLKEILYQFLDATPNIDKYLDFASKIQNKDVGDDMYPME